MKRTRIEYYKAHVLESTLASTKAKQKVIDINNFYSQTDLYTINDLSKINPTTSDCSNMIDGENFESIICQLEENFNRGPTEKEKIIQLEDELEDDDIIIIDSEKRSNEDDNVEHLEGPSNKRFKNDQEIIEADSYQHENNNLIWFQIQDILLTKSDIKTLSGEEWLNGTIIVAFMSSFKDKKKVHALYYSQIAKIIDGSVQDNIFPKVLVKLLKLVFSIFKSLI